MSIVIDKRPKLLRERKTSNFVPGTVSGYKALSFSRRNYSVKSPTRNYHWKDGWNRYEGGYPSFSKPDARIGLYAEKTLAQTKRYGRKVTYPIYCRVEAKGLVFKGDEAFRAEYMRITHIAAKRAPYRYDTLNTALLILWWVIVGFMYVFLPHMGTYLAIAAFACSFSVEAFLHLKFRRYYYSDEYRRHLAKLFPNAIIVDRIEDLTKL